MVALSWATVYGSGIQLFAIKIGGVHLFLMHQRENRIYAMVPTGTIIRASKAIPEIWVLKARQERWALRELPEIGVPKDPEVLQLHPIARDTTIHRAPMSPSGRVEIAG
jgi:hypothetical protein